MTTIHSRFNKIKNSLSNYFIVDSHESLLKKVNLSLLVFENEIINLETGQSQKLEDYSADSLSMAAKNIISASQKKCSIALFLPSDEFIATSYYLPEVEKHDILSAVKYQQDELLPTDQQSLLVSVLHDELADNHYAIWFSTQRVNSLFDAFIKNMLSISVLFPASFIFSTSREQTIGSHDKKMIFCEQGDAYFLLTEFNQGQLQNWDYFYRKDLLQKEFKLQFQTLWDDKYPETNFSSVDIVNNKEKWLNIVNNNLPKKDYGFYPHKAESFIKKESRFRKGRFAGILFILLIFALSIPFINTASEYNHIEKAYNLKIEESKLVRKARESVLNHEDNWAAFDQHPQVDMSEMFLKINQLIPKNSWLSSFEMNEGIVEIEGYSPHPSEILELLSQQKDFEQIKFNQNIRSERGKNKDHFGISFHLIDINEEAYYKTFFIDKDSL